MWASLTSLSRVGPGPRTRAAMTTKGLTRKRLAEPFMFWRARRATIAIRERIPASEYWCAWARAGDCDDCFTDDTPSPFSTLATTPALEELH